MIGKKVFKHAVTRMPQAIMEGMIANQLKLEDIDMVIPHQANLRINEMVGKMIGLPPEKMHNNIQKVRQHHRRLDPALPEGRDRAGQGEARRPAVPRRLRRGLTWGSVFVRF